MILSREFQDNYALAIIALMLKRDEILKTNDEDVRTRLIDEYELNVATLDKALDYLAEIRKRVNQDHDK